MSYTSGACTGVVADIAGSDSPEGHYTVATSNMGATTYTLTATPHGAQADDECGDLTLDHTGEQDVTNADSSVISDNCW